MTTHATMLGLLTLAATLQAGCGAATGLPAEEATVTRKACPCERRSTGYLLTDEPLTVGTTSFHIGGKPAVISTWHGGVRKQIPTGLDVALACTSLEGPRGSGIAVAGCRGDASVVRVFAAGDPEVEPALRGEYVLPPEVCLLGITQDPRGGWFAVDAAGRQVLHLGDADDDGVPDHHRTYASGTSELLGDALDLHVDRAGHLVGVEPGCIVGNLSFLAVDLDGDGNADRSGDVPWTFAEAEGPTLAAPPQSTDTHVDVLATPGAHVEVWRTGARGLGADEPPTCIGRGVADADGRTHVALTWTLGVEDRLVPVDTAWQLRGTPQRVHPPYALAERLIPAAIPAREGGRVAVRGRGLQHALTVELEVDGRVLPLVPGPTDGSGFEVIVPPLGDVLATRAHLVVRSADTPPSCGRLRLQLEHEPAR